MKAKKKDIIAQAEYILVLATKIKEAANNVENDSYERNSGGKSSGTINNLSPELSKAASKIAQMNKYGWH